MKTETTQTQAKPVKTELDYLKSIDTNIGFLKNFVVFLIVLTVLGLLLSFFASVGAFS